METEPEKYLEELRPVRAKTAAWLEEDHMRSNPDGANQWASVSYGYGFSQCFQRDTSGKWQRVKYVRNPEYWNRDGALFVCDVWQREPTVMYCRFPMSQTTERGNLKTHVNRALARLLLKEWNKPLLGDGREGVFTEPVELELWNKTEKPRFQFISGEFRPVK